MDLKSMTLSEYNIKLWKTEKHILPHIWIVASSIYVKIWKRLLRMGIVWNLENGVILGDEEGQNVGEGHVSYRRCKLGFFLS